MSTDPAKDDEPQDNQSNDRLGDRLDSMQSARTSDHASSATKQVQVCTPDHTDSTAASQSSLISPHMLEIWELQRRMAENEAEIARKRHLIAQICAENEAIVRTLRAIKAKRKGSTDDLPIHHGST